MPHTGDLTGFHGGARGSKWGFDTAAHHHSERFDKPLSEMPTLAPIVLGGQAIHQQVL